MSYTLNRTIDILKKIKNSFFILLVTGYWLLVTKTVVFATGGALDPVLSGEINTNFGTAAGAYRQQEILAIIGLVINTFLGLLGVIFLILIIYGGFRWLMARGVDAEVTKVRNLIEHSIIGLIVVVAAFVISKFVLAALQNIVFR